MTPIECICIHAFITDDIGSHYCDESEEVPSGWCVYLRTHNDTNECFDIPSERDFPTEEDALEWAYALAAQHNVPIRHY